jgi:hypothetical protein
MFDFIPGKTTRRNSSGRFAVRPTRARLVQVAAALSAIAIAAPVSTAAAATGGPADKPAATLTGATYITTAPTTFINDNNQVSASNTSIGDQTAY